MLLYRHLFRRSDLLIYVSENQRDHWRNWGLRAAADVVVHNGIDVDYFSVARTPRDEHLNQHPPAFSPSMLLASFTAQNT